MFETAAGYSGGTTENPTYEVVCGGSTGHAEVVQVKYDAARISYEKLLQTFWSSHRPQIRAGRKQDPEGQYRSLIFFHSPEQEKLAQASKAAQEAKAGEGWTVATAIVPAARFYRAEDYHQQYIEKLGRRR